MTESGREVPVAAAVALREGRYLVGRRPAHKRHGGFWEFPGGKVGDGESLADGISRELAEELGVRVAATGSILFTARDPGSPFLIHFLEVVLAGEPRAMEHDQVGWFTPVELAELPLAPTDARFVREVLAGGSGG